MMKSAKLEWALNNLEVSLELLKEAIETFEDFPKLWLMKGQIEEQQKQVEKAIETYNQGVSTFANYLGILDYARSGFAVPIKGSPLV